MDARHKHQRKFIAAKKAAGLERLILWVRPEDKESLKAPGHKPQPAQIVWLALRSSSRRLAPARRSSPMAGNRAGCWTSWNNTASSAWRCRPDRSSGSLWDVPGRLSLSLALHGPPETRSCAFFLHGTFWCCQYQSRSRSD